MDGAFASFLIEIYHKLSNMSIYIFFVKLMYKYLKYIENLQYILYYIYNLYNTLCSIKLFLTCFVEHNEIYFKMV